MMRNTTLPSGKIATIKDGKGKDLFWAQKMANDTSEIMKMLMIRLVLIDGQAITEDDLDNMDISDVLMLTNEFGKIFSPLLAQQQS
jgi:hypothetical protein